MDVAIWLKYGPELSPDKAVAGVERAAIEIAKVLDGKVDVTVYGRGTRREHITPDIPFVGIKCKTEVEYIRKCLKVIPSTDILHCMSHAYFHFLDERRGKVILNLRGAILPLIWSRFSITRRDRAYTREEKRFIQDNLANIRRWGGRGFEGVDYVLANCNHVLKFAKRMFPNKPAETIYNPVALRPFLKERGDYIVYAGVLHYEKGVDLLVETARLLENRGVATPILVLGTAKLWNMKYSDEPWIKMFEGRGNVVYLGARGRDEVLKWMGGAKVGFVPSRRDVIPNSALEMLSCGTPVVASNVAGMPEAVVHDKCGLLSKPDPESFADNLEYLLRNPRVRRRMGVWGRERIRKVFDPKRISQKYIRVYGRVMKL